MKILAFLQNMYFKDPERVGEMFNRHPDRRNYLIASYLFMGCLTGKRLEQVFGSLCDSIIWEEVSRKIGGHSASVFPADLEHINASIAQHKPEIILAFGAVAKSAIEKINPQVEVIYSCHPAARKNAVAELNKTKTQLDNLIFGKDFNEQ
jgi:hypothetical protein